jgi:3-deoxy-D-manno-octulosonate 8-phosphate phosphatase (KDO 8-P phosphatase)
MPILGRPALRKTLKSLKLVVLDVDGTLTDGRLWYGPAGEELKMFDVRDGHGLRLLGQCTGTQLAVLTGRRADLVRQRCQELGIGTIVERSRQKGRDFERICKELGVTTAEACMIGDDVNDLPALALAGLAACPSDAAPEVRKVSGFISKHPGGHGAVRELCEEWLRATVGWPPPEPETSSFEIKKP